MLKTLQPLIAVVLAVAASLAGAWIVNRRRAAPAPPPAPEPAVETAPVPPESAPALAAALRPAPPAPALAVTVEGAVRRPGLYRLEAGARVQHAIAAAGGPAEYADLSDINLAARVRDASILTLPESPPGGAPAQYADSAAALNPPFYTVSGWRPEDAAAPGAAPPGLPASPAAGGPIDLNTATQAELETLPGIGPTLAERILAHRAERRFERIEDLGDVHGIGDKTIEAVRPHVAVR